MRVILEERDAKQGRKLSAKIDVNGEHIPCECGGEGVRTSVHVAVHRSFLTRSDARRESHVLLKEFGSEFAPPLVPEPVPGFRGFFLHGLCLGRHYHDIFPCRCG